MKTRTLLAATLAATLALAGCSKNDEPDGPTRAAVNIRTSIGGTTDAGNFGSRAAISADGSGNFEAGDVLGLYVTVGATAKLANSAYTVGSTALWWDELSMTDPVAFAAYYPKAEAITDPAAYIFNAATATNPDLLLATPVTASKGEDVALAFRHAMHRLTVNLSTDIDGWDITTAQVSLAGMNASATVDITAGTVTLGEADATDGDYGTKTGASTTFVLAPQKVTADAVWIQITMDGEQYVYKVPASITLPSGGTAPLTALESGKTLTLNLALTRDGVTLTTGDIAAWDTQGTINGEINIGGGDTPTDGNIDMTAMTADQVKAAIQAALAAGFTEITLTGELSKIGMGDTDGTFVGNTQIKKCDLTGVTGWVDATLPDRAFMRCSALQEVVLPDDVQVIETYAFAFCPALATVNLAQVTRIGESAFRESTSLTELSLDNVEAIALHAFYGCTGLQTLRLPKCTRFGSYIVTGCKALTRIEATAAGDFVDIDNNSDIENNAVFHNRGGSIGHTGDKAFNPETCDLVLNVDKKEGGTGHPTATTDPDFTWTTVNALPMIWQSITYK